MSFIISLLVNSLSIYIAAWLLPGVTVRDLYSAVLVAVVLGLVNTFIKPLLLLLTLPLNILTLGLFTFVVNAALVLLVDYFLSGFAVSGFVAALIFALVVSIISSLLSRLVK